MCIADQSLSDTELFVCSNGTNAEHECINEGPVLNLTTTLSIYTRKATTINARSNWTILSVPELSPPTKINDTDIAELRAAIRWLLDYDAAGIPPVSAFMTLFWNSGARTQFTSSDWTTDLIRAFRSMMLVPMWFFTVTNYGNPALRPSPDALVTIFPPEFTTSASLARPSSKIIINTTMFYAYVVLQLSALLFSWGVVLALLVRRKASPDVSSYPLIDFASKTLQSNVPAGVDGIEDQLRDLTGADNGRIRSRLAKSKMYLRVVEVDDGGHLGGSEKAMVLVASGRSPLLEKLRPGQNCR